MVRAGAALVALTGCSSLLGLDPPVLRDAPSDERAADAPIDAAPVCASDFTATFRGSKYFYSATAVTWLEAEKTCRDTSPTTHLVVIADVDELAYVAGLAPNAVWIGLTDLVMQGTYRWVTKENIGGFPPASGAPWANNQPSTVAGDDCAFLATAARTFSMTACTAQGGYICECDAYPEDPASYTP